MAITFLLGSRAITKVSDCRTNCKENRGALRLKIQLTGIVPQHQITLTLTPSVFPGQKAGSTTTSKPTTAQRQKRAKHATFEPLFIQKSLTGRRPTGPLSSKGPHEGSIRVSLSRYSEPSHSRKPRSQASKFKHRFTRHPIRSGPTRSLPAYI